MGVILALRRCQLALASRHPKLEVAKDLALRIGRPCREASTSRRASSNAFLRRRARGVTCASALNPSQEDTTVVCEPKQRLDQRQSSGAQLVHSHACCAPSNVSSVCEHSVAQSGVACRCPPETSIVVGPTSHILSFREGTDTRWANLHDIGRGSISCLKFGWLQIGGGKVKSK
jgi:hypothetical protein